MPMLLQYQDMSLFLQPTSSPVSMHSLKVLKWAPFRQVGESTPEDTEHPCQGALPYWKLVWQPSTQLPAVLASCASFAVTDIDAADDGSGDDDVRRDKVPRVTACPLGFWSRATCFGAST